MKEDDTVNALKQHLALFEAEGRRVYATSSFQTQSVPLLHMISRHFPKIPILFIDTGYLFAETYAFKNEMEERFELNVVTLRSEKSYTHQMSQNGLFMYAQDTNYCCFMNKVEPIDAHLNPGDVWISGVRRDQTGFRKKMKVVEKDEKGIIKLHPMLEWNSKDVYDYIRKYKLPKHPLEKEGYKSIGCVPCTHKQTLSDARDGRWVGSAKTECGLHTFSAASGNHKVNE